MRIVDRSLPYPVLSPLRDDVSPIRFDLDCSCRSDARSYYVKFALLQQNSTLSQMIEESGAAYAVHVECRDCFYRVLHKAEAASGLLQIPADDVTGTVEITGFVVAS